MLDHVPHFLGGPAHRQPPRNWSPRLPNSSILFGRTGIPATVL